MSLLYRYLPPLVLNTISSYTQHRCSARLCAVRVRLCPFYAFTKSEKSQ